MSELEAVANEEFVRVKNLDDKPLRITYNSIPTVIAPGGWGFVNREAAAIHFGVWQSVVGGRPIDRVEEYKRIRGLYGCFPGMTPDPAGPKWEDVKPKVEIYEMNSETPVANVIDDPEGENIPVTERGDEAHLRAQMAAMQDALADMQVKLDKSELISAAMTSPELPPADSPDTAPRRRRQEPKIEGARLDEQAVGE